MAEYVHQCLEEMIPELEEMNQLGLFTADETQIILKKREGFEYRLRQVTKTKASFLNYIEYEKKLLELLKIRRQKIASNSNEREIEKSIADRIHQLFRLLTTRFQEDVSLWQQHIDFSKALDEKAYVSRLYEKVLKIYSHEEDLWIAAAQWESSPDGNNNPEQARKVLLKAHRVNPESQNIFLEMFHMELQLAKHIFKRKKTLVHNEEVEDEAERDKAAALVLAQILYNKGIEIFPGLPDFHMKMLNIASMFKIAEKVQKNIVADLQGLYPHNASVWNCLALINLNNVQKMDSDLRKIAVRECLETYSQAVETLPTDEMWTYCLRCHLNFITLKWVPNRTEHLRDTLLIFQKAASVVNLSEELYTELLGLLDALSLPNDAASVADSAVNQHPHSPSLWMSKLRLMAEHDKEDQDILKVLRTAVKNIQPEVSWPLWEFVLNVLASRGSEELESLMDKACRFNSPEVSRLSKEWCLHWTIRQGGIKSARLVFARLKTMRPISLSFYRLYIQAECAQETPNLKLVRAAFEDALGEFGREEPDLWLNYMEMEREISQDPGRAGIVQQRALSTLGDSLKEVFHRKQLMTV